MLLINHGNSRRPAIMARVVTAIALCALAALAITCPPFRAFADTGLQATQLTSKTDISKARVKPIAARSFNGEPRTPKPEVLLHGKKLKRGRDYSLEYEGNVRPGKAKVTIHGKGAYAGKAVARFVITPKYRTIGDSYSRGCGTWPRLMRSMLGLKYGGEFRHYSRSGGPGWATERNFEDLIEHEKRDETVSDVLVLGGTGNDLRKGKAEISSAYKKTIKTIRRIWPNARIMHASPNWNLCSSWYRSTMQRHLPWYKALGEKLGVVYLPSCEKVLHGRWDLMRYDGNHPNSKGQMLIAKAMMRDIRALR